MTSSKPELHKIEELRRKLYRELGSQYDPVRMQALAPISQEFDRLAVELARREMNKASGNIQG